MGKERGLICISFPLLCIGGVKKGDHDPADENRQIGRKGRGIGKFAQKLFIVMPEGAKDLFTKIGTLFPREFDPAVAGGQIDGMQNQTEETVNKIFPSPRFRFQAVPEEGIVEFEDA